MQLEAQVPVLLQWAHSSVQHLLCVWQTLGLAVWLVTVPCTKLHTFW